MTNLRNYFSLRQTAQNQPIPGSGQVKNAAGGYAWQVDDWMQLDRFLVLGSEGGTYYIRPQTLTIDNTEAVIRCLDEDGVRVVAETPPDTLALKTIWAFEQAKRAADEEVILKLIEAHNLPWEAIPTQWPASAEVWRALLPKLPMTAMLRDLGRLTANGVLVPMNAETRLVVERLTDAERLRRARIHPVAVLAALLTYQQGRGVRGKLSWVLGSCDPNR